MDKYGWDEAGKRSGIHSPLKYDQTGQGEHTDNPHDIWMPGVNPPVWTPDTLDYQDHVIGVPAMEGQCPGIPGSRRGFDNLTWSINYPKLEASGLVSGISLQGTRVKSPNINVKLPGEYNLSQGSHADSRTREQKIRQQEYSGG